MRHASSRLVSSSPACLASASGDVFSSEAVKKVAEAPSHPHYPHLLLLHLLCQRSISLWSLFSLNSIQGKNRVKSLNPARINTHFPNEWNRRPSPNCLIPSAHWLPEPPVTRQPRSHWSLRLVSFSCLASFWGGGGAGCRDALKHLARADPPPPHPSGSTSSFKQQRAGDLTRGLHQDAPLCAGASEDAEAGTWRIFLSVAEKLLCLSAIGVCSSLFWSLWPGQLEYLTLSPSEDVY